MPFILAAIGVLIAAAVWYQRARAAKDAAGDLIGAANDARLAARRFGYRMKANVHPVELIEDPRLAAAGVAAAVAGMDGPLTREEIDQLAQECQVVFGAERAEACAGGGGEVEVFVGGFVFFGNDDVGGHSGLVGCGARMIPFEASDH